MFKKISGHKIISQRNSIFNKLLLPIVAVMLFQVMLISVVLFANGTIHSLEEEAKNSLYRNAENRSITLESMMVHTWSNIDKLEGDVSSSVSKYLTGTNTTIETVLKTPEHKNELLSILSGDLLSAIRMTSSSGVFLFFADESNIESGEASLNGLYFRDLDPVMTSSDYSDIIFEKGSADIARKNNIQLSSLWSELYKLDSSKKEAWDAVFAPFKAALKYPDLTTKDLAFWSAPHYIEPSSNLDTNQCISYTRPIFYNGRLIGVIGTEIQMEYLKKYFPSDDIDPMGGYMLVRYDSNQKKNEKMSGFVCAVTGSYIKRLADFGNVLTFEKSESENIYTVESEKFEKTQAALQPLKLYNTNAPFSDECWALTALAPNEVLFTSPNKLKAGVFHSSLITFVIGLIIMFFSIRLTTRPLLKIAGQIETGGPDDPVVIKNSKTYEIVLLCDTINEMKGKRKDTETALREERERYMIALESATDTFMEYDIAKDRFMVYFFTDENQKSALSSKIIDNFDKKAANDEICHPADMCEFLTILHGKSNHPCEVRLRTSLFPHIKNEEADGEYYWFLFKASQIYGKDDSIEKIIGSARQITNEKLAEYARLEATHRDTATGLYNRDYGELLIMRTADAAIETKTQYTFMAISADNFDSFEAYYGRVFSAVILHEISGILLANKKKDDVIIRWSNDEFVIFCPKGHIEVFKEIIKDIRGQIYTGENTDLSLQISAGIAASNDAAEPEKQLLQAFAALRKAQAQDSEQIISYGHDIMDDELLNKAFTKRTSATPLAVDMSQDAIVGFVFNLIEHTTDVKSVIHMLIRILGEIFSLDQILICEYDRDFGSNQVAYQWNKGNVQPYHTDIERTTHTDFENLTELMDESGVLHYNSKTSNAYSQGVQQLLCINPLAKFSALCCTMYENGTPVGRMLFFVSDPERVCTEAEANSLYEITKIVSTQLSLAKSNSASKAKSEFLSRMSHEIRTPMNAIIGMTKIAQDAGQNFERVEDCLEKIDFSAKHLLSLINDILDMSRIESGKMKIEAQPFSLENLVYSLDTLMRPQLEGKDISFVINKTFFHENIVSDEQKLRQVLINLLGNAGKFTNPGGSITLSIEQTPGKDDSFSYCRFSVLDTGVGIAKEEQFKIFNAFEQSESGTALEGRLQGTGLGLAISSSFIGAMGGRIELESEKGKGSEFFFTLKLLCDTSKTDEAAVPKKEKEDCNKKNFQGKRVLIVDDNEINLEIAKFIVEEIGFIVETAKDGQEAVNMFLSSASGYYDIIFMDISMPVMDGLTATREIRKNTTHKNARTIPIIAMTANAFSEDTKKSIESGMNAHVAKPIDAAFLCETLNRLLLSE